MVALMVPAYVAAPVLLASCHGLSDLARPIGTLGWYALPLVVSPALRLPTTCLFVAASVVHFARDVDMVVSVVLHAALVALSVTARTRAVAWPLFAVYYTCVHSRLQMQQWYEAAPRQAALALLVGCVVGCSWPSNAVLAVTDRMQALVCAHILTEASFGPAWTTRGDIRVDGMVNT